jgi:hypothetical protein
MCRLVLPPRTIQMGPDGSALPMRVVISRYRSLNPAPLPRCGPPPGRSAHRRVWATRPSQSASAAQSVDRWLFREQEQAPARVIPVCNLCHEGPPCPAIVYRRPQSRCGCTALPGLRVMPPPRTRAPTWLGAPESYTTVFLRLGGAFSATLCRRMIVWVRQRLSRLCAGRPTLAD